MLFLARHDCVRDAGCQFWWAGNSIGTRVCRTDSMSARRMTAQKQHWNKVGTPFQSMPGPPEPASRWSRHAWNGVPMLFLLVPMLFLSGHCSQYQCHARSLGTPFQLVPMMFQRNIASDTNSILDVGNRFRWLGNRLETSWKSSFSNE